MNSVDFETIVNAQMKRCNDVLFSKAKEYADNKNDERLHNFKRVAGFTGQDLKVVLFGMWAKHLASVKDMCLSNEHYSMDMWNEKITDTINYALLLKALVVEQENIYTQEGKCRQYHNPFDIPESSMDVKMSKEQFDEFYRKVVAPADPLPTPHDYWDPNVGKAPNDIPQNPVECGPNSACMTH